jgi:chromosome segregation ATPase
LIEVLQDKITLLNNENSQLKEMIEADRDDVTDLEKTGHEVEELHLEIEQLREDSARTCRELEETVERLRFEKDKILENEDKKFLLVKERVKELEVENAQLQKLGNESRMCCDLERKIEGDVEKLRLELDEVQDLLNRRNEKVLLAEKVGLTNDFVHNEAINLSTLTTMMLY